MIKERKRTRWLVPATWPIFIKISIGVVAVVALALGVTGYVNVRTLQRDLRGKIGSEFEILAVDQSRRLADIFAENLTIVRSIALAESIRVGAVVGNAGYSGTPESIEAELLALNEQWQTADDNSTVVRSIVDPRVNYLASQLSTYRQAFPNHAEIFLTNRYGGLLAATSRISDYYRADEEWWQIAYNDGLGAFYIGQPEFDEDMGATVILLATPIYSRAGDRVIGIAATSFRMDAIYEAVSGMKIGETGHVTIVDPTGFIVADSHPECVGQRLPSPWIEPEALQEPGHRDKLVDEEDIPMLVGHASITGAHIAESAVARAIRTLGWTLFVQQAQKEAYAPVTSAARTNFVAIGVFALVAAVLAFALAQVVVAPITDLVDAARRMASGDLSARALVRRRDETGELAAAFNSMADEVAGMVDSLEHQVAERTADLQQRTAELEQLARNLEDAVDQSRRRALRLEASAQVAQVASSELDPDALLNRVVDLIADRSGFYHAGIFLLDGTGQYAVLRAANSEGGRRMLARSHRLRVGQQGIVGYVTGTGRPRIALDVGADAVFFDNPDLPHTRSEMSLPLIARGRILGALDVQSLEPAAFDDEDVAVLGTLADQIAVALDNARLFDELQDTLREMQKIQALYTAHAWRKRQAEQQANVFEYTRPGVAPLAAQLPPEIDRVAVRGETAVTSGDGDGQTPASLVVPLKLYGQTIGVLGFQETEPGRVWTEDEIALAKASAYEIAQLLESARLFEDTQQRAWREHAVGQITAHIRAGTDVEDILQAAAEELGRTLGVSRAIVRLGKIE